MCHLTKRAQNGLKSFILTIPIAIYQLTRLDNLRIRNQQPAYLFLVAISTQYKPQPATITKFPGRKSAISAKTLRFSFPNKSRKTRISLESHLKY